MSFVILNLVIPELHGVPSLAGDMSEDQVQEVSSTVPDEGMEKQVREGLLSQGFHHPNLFSRGMIIHPYLKFLPYHFTDNQIDGQDWLCGCSRCMGKREAQPKPQNLQN